MTARIIQIIKEKRQQRNILPSLDLYITGPLHIKRDMIHACQIQEHDLRFYGLFNCVSGISGQWEVIMQDCVQWKLFTVGKITASSNQIPGDHQASAYM